MGLGFLTSKLGCQHRTTPKGSAHVHTGCPPGLWGTVVNSLLYTLFLSQPSWLLSGWPKCQFPYELGLDPRNVLGGSSLEILPWRLMQGSHRARLTEGLCSKGPWVGALLRSGWRNWERPCCCGLRMSLFTFLLTLLSSFPPSQLLPVTR